MTEWHELHIPTGSLEKFDMRAYIIFDRRNIYRSAGTWIIEVLNTITSVGKPSVTCSMLGAM
jgi:hypothetical protein